MSLTPDDVAAMFATRIAGGQVTPAARSPKSAPPELTEETWHCAECGQAFVRLVSPRRKATKVRRLICEVCADF